jgi:hypothetical protein
MSWSFQRENMWVQDFPICVDEETNKLLPFRHDCEFGSYLKTVLAHMRMTENCQRTFGLSSSCFAVDFSAAKAKLVASVPGQWSLHHGFEREAFGFLRLRALVREAGWSPHNNRASNIVCQSGSIGSDFSHENFFDDFMLSLGGANVVDTFENQNHESSEENDLDANVDNPLLDKEHGRYPANLSIFFPSKLMAHFNAVLYERYKTQTNGRSADIHCTVSSWHSLTYPTTCFRYLIPPGSAGNFFFLIFFSKFTTTLF